MKHHNMRRACRARARTYTHTPTHFTTRYNTRYIPDALLVTQDLFVFLAHPLTAVGGIDHGDLLHGVHQLHLAGQRELVVQLRPDLKGVGGRDRLDFCCNVVDPENTVQSHPLHPNVCWSARRTLFKSDGQRCTQKQRTVATEHAQNTTIHIYSPG